MGLRIAAPWVLATGLFFLLLDPPGATAQSSPQGPRELYQALNALRVAPGQVYYIRDLHIRRDAVRLTLAEGKLAFLASYNGQLTGAVFTGRGHALALLRDPIERRSLARFLDAPLLDERFSSAYFRFTDNTGEELLQQLHEAGTEPAAEPGFAEGWNETVANLNPWHSLRILTDWLAEAPHPYFYVGLLGEVTGAFDVLVDDRRAEQVLLGQPRWVSGERFYDVWASFRRANAPAPQVTPFVAAGYAIETSILPDRTLEGATTLALKAVRGGERVIPLELSRSLTVQSVEDAAGRPLIFFQNEAVNRHEIEQRGNDALLVVLPAGARRTTRIWRIDPTASDRFPPW